jgi:hypothetical protein
VGLDTRYALIDQHVQAHAGAPDARFRQHVRAHTDASCGRCMLIE